MHHQNKSRPSAEYTGTAQNNTDAPIISHGTEDCTRYSTLRAQLAVCGYSVAHGFVVRRHGHEPVILATLDALQAFVRGVL